MAFEIPMDLIRQVQIAVRMDTGLPTYDPHDPSLPPLSPLEASIAGLHPSSPADLRCQNCKGKLQRGIESLLCIYCGEKQENKDLSPRPISFNSTLAYKWLLQSLDLDQSETIGPSTEEFKLKRRIPKKEISLHDLLNLPITRSNESENPEASVTNNTLEQSSSSLNLTGDLDNIFSGTKRFIAYGASEEPVIAEKIESNESKVSESEENLSLFSTVRSSEDNSHDSSSSEYAEDFQSANKLEGSKSPNPFIGSVVDLSSDMDSAFGQGKDQKTGKLENYSEQARSTADWMHDDLSQQSTSSPCIQNGAAVTNNILSEVPASEFRQIDDARSEIEEAPENRDVFNNTTQTMYAKDDAEILMPQMHDLSFMFQNN